MAGSIMGFRQTSQAQVCDEGGGSKKGGDFLSQIQEEEIQKESVLMASMMDKGFKKIEKGFSYNTGYLDRVANMWMKKGKTPGSKTRKTGKRVITASPSGSYTLWWKKK